MRFAANCVFGGRDALRSRKMCKLNLAGHIADGKDRGDFGAAVIVRLDKAAFVGLESCIFKMQSLGDGFAADGAQK